MNTYRTSKSGCEHIIKHKASCEGCTFSYQIIETFLGTGYDETGKVDPDMTKKRQFRDDFWIKRLRTLYP